MSTEIVTSRTDREDHRYGGEPVNMNAVSLESLAVEDAQNPPSSDAQLDSQPRTAKHVAAKLLAVNFALLVAGMNGMTYSLCWRS